MQEDELDAAVAEQREMMAWTRSATKETLAVQERIATALETLVDLVRGITNEEE